MLFGDRKGSWLESQILRVERALDGHIEECKRVREQTRTDVAHMSDKLEAKIDATSKIQDDRLRGVIRDQNGFILRFGLGLVTLLVTIIGLLLRKEGILP